MIILWMVIIIVINEWDFKSQKVGVNCYLYYKSDDGYCLYNDDGYCLYYQVLMLVTCIIKVSKSW